MVAGFIFEGLTGLDAEGLTGPTKGLVAVGLGGPMEGLTGPGDAGLPTGGLIGPVE